MTQSLAAVDGPWQAAERDTEPALILVGGDWCRSQGVLDVEDPDGGLAGSTYLASGADVQRAIDASHSARQRRMPAHIRMSFLREAAQRLETESESMAHLIASEGIKTIREARGEVSRAVETLRLSSEEARRVDGQTITFDQVSAGVGRMGFTVRDPVGMVGAITPFNDPLNLVVHKVGPALAAGNAVVVKPDPRTPLSALRLAHILVESGVLPGFLSVLPGRSDVGASIAKHPLVDLISFTGGFQTGDRIARLVGAKRSVMELGGNSGVIVHHDADLELAVERCVSGAWAAAGQNCLHVQRIYAHVDAYDDFVADFVRRTRKLTLGAKLNESTDMGPLIDDAAARRIDAILQEAEDAGAQIATGGGRQGLRYEPTVLLDAPDSCTAIRDEVFGPVTSIIPYRDLDEAITAVNATPYGLHGAIFTEDIRSAFTAIRGLRCAGVMINDSTDFRIDAMPFGGMKQSGIGREGVRSAIEHMTEEKLISFNAN